LKTLFDNILYRDVMVRNQITNEREIKELVYYVMSNVGKPFTYSSLAKVLGVKSSTTVKNYLEYIENTYLLSSVSRLDYSVKAQLLSPKKSYAIDNALARRLGFHFTKDEGRLLENAVYIELRRRGGEIYYHNSGKCECDFVVRDGFQVVQALQVCLSFDMPDTRERELRGVQDAMRTYGLPEGLIVTNNQEEEVACEEGVVKVIPGWKWMIGK
jgi:predicted AAA+ superfamily ATPase